ncbi:hypothetical protein C8R43DRAFT_1142979 [Mycena crocata]|nr:hypothetical protein C8R43DRAFT_1142979 [Mycena crocata]
MTQDSTAPRTRPPCEPLFYPAHASHVNTLAHDVNTKGRYYVVGNGYAEGVYTDFSDAEKQTSGYPHSAMRVVKTWAGPDGVEGTWKSYCTLFHPNEAPCPQPLLPSGFDAPTPVVRPTPILARTRLLPTSAPSFPRVPVPAAIPSSSGTILSPSAPSTPIRAPALSQAAPSPLVKLEPVTPALPATPTPHTTPTASASWQTGEPWVGWDSPSISRGFGAAGHDATCTGSRPRVTPQTRIELTARRPLLEAMAAVSSSSSASSFSLSSVGSSDLTDDDNDDNDDATSTTAAAASPAAVVLPADQNGVYWAVEGVEQLFPTAEQALAARADSPIARPMLMRSANVVKLADFSSGA